MTDGAGPAGALPAEGRQLRVLFVPGDAAAAEERAAWSWLSSADGVAARVPYTEGERGQPGWPPDVAWVHASRPLGPARVAGIVETLGEAPPPLLLSLAAAELPARLGWPEPGRPELEERTWRDADDELYLFESFSVFPHIRGHMGLRAHPLFAGLGSGAYTWWARDGEHYVAVTCPRPEWAGGRAVAVERSYIHVNDERATIWESAGPTGPVLCIGAHFRFAATDDYFGPQLRRLAGNALRHAARPRGAEPATSGAGVWLTSVGAPTIDGALPVAPPSPTPSAIDLAWAGVSQAGPVEPGTAADVDADGSPDPAAASARVGNARGRPLTLAGRRAFLAGDEGAGVAELWIHPLRAVADFRLRLDGAEPRAVAARVTPVLVSRELRAGVPRETVSGAGDADAPLVTELLLVPREGPGAVLEWQAHRSVELELSWTSDLRLMWPYPAEALGPLRWRLDAPALTIAVGGAGCDDAVAFRLAGGDASLEARPAGDGRGHIHCRARARLDAGAVLRLAVAGGGDAAAAVRALGGLEDAGAVAGARAAGLRRLAASGLGVRASDARVGEAVEWAKYRLDALRVEAPDLGRSLVAGYWRSSPGWGDGRPGYAWFFGRDAVWTALGSLAVGDFDASRDVVRFLGRHQDVSGKILHECSTSGAVHYDSADATPLYLLLVARHLAWSGDAAFVAGEWGRVRAAFHHCLWMDHDGDGLIENTRSGHGWIEFGRLGGGAVTFYNAGIWTAALRELAYAAETLGDAAFAGELRARHDVARRALHELFWDAETRGYALNLRREGEGWVRNTARAVMQAVPLLLDVVDAGPMAGWLDASASDDFAAPWGVRMVPLSDPQYDPGSYHGGAVWPLFTGWASWAQYAAGRAEAGHRLWRSNVELAFRHERGAWPEVLRGDEERLAGVCPDQAWSTGMAVAPLVHGLLGAVPDAPRAQLRLRPQVPEAWPWLEVERLRVGDCDVAVRYEREGSLHRFRVRQDRGAVPLRLIFEAALPAERLAEARVDGRPAELSTRRFGERLLAPLQVVLDAERTIELVAWTREE